VEPLLPASILEAKVRARPGSRLQSQRLERRVRRRRRSKNKLTRILGVGLLLALVTASPALATRNQPDLQVTIRGTVTGAETGVDETAHGCDADVVPPLWRFFSSSTGTDRIPPRQGRLLPDPVQLPGPEGRDGTITFTAANGDILVIAQEGSSEVIGDFDGYARSATWTVVVGTGRVAGATGSGTLDGVGDIPGGDLLFGLPEGGIRFSIAGGIAYYASARAR
jgi:hypothetical protein